MDVDKADYLLRDNHYLDSSRLFPSNKETNKKFEVRQKDIIDIFYNARVSDNRRHVEYKTADFEKIYHLFNTRSQFHIAMYRNPECLFIENLLAELVKERDQESTYKLSEVDSRSIKDFTELTDKYVCSELDKFKNPVFQKKWKALQKLSYSELIDERPNSYKVHVEIEYAGTKMNEHDIPFYGELKDKPYVDQRKGLYKTTAYYIINDSNNNDN